MKVFTGITFALMILLLAGCAEEKKIDLTRKGMKQFEAGQYDEAIRYFDRSIKKNANDADAFYFRGMCRYKKEEFSMAIEDFTRAIALRPESDDYYFARGTARVKSGDINGGCGDFTSAAALGNVMAKEAKISICN